MMMWRALRPREIVTALRGARRSTPPAPAAAPASASGGAKIVTETGTANDPQTPPVVPSVQTERYAKKDREP